MRKHLVRRAFKSSYTSLEDGVTGPINYINEIYIHIQFILLCIKGGGIHTFTAYRIQYMCILVSVRVHIRIIRQKKKLLSFTEQRTVSLVHIELDVSNNRNTP